MNLTKKQTAKIIALLVLVIVLNLIFPISSNAAGLALKITDGILTKAIGLYVVGCIDGVNRLMGALFLPPTIILNDLGEVVEDTYEGEKHYMTEEKLWEALNESNPVTLVDQFINAGLLSPDRIFNGDVALLDANIFAVDASDTAFSDLKNGISGTSLAAGLKKAVSNIYVVLRNISAVILLCLLIYTGIRILISNVNPYQQAEWKKSLIDWLKALCSLIFMHFLMIGIFYISDLIVDSLQVSFGNMSITALIRKAFFEASIWDRTECMICIIMYAYTTYLTAVFLIAYFKRLIWIVILIIISPVVAVTQALGKKQQGIFSNWLKEYTFTVLLQPFHILIFYILVALPLSLTGVGSGPTNWFAQFAFEPSNYAVYLYALIAMSLIRPAEKFLYGLFGFNSSQIAKQGTSESGVKVLKQVEKVVKDVANVAISVAGAAATGGATLAAGGAITPSGGATPASGRELPLGDGGLPLGDGELPLDDKGMDGMLSNSTLDEQISGVDGELNNLYSNEDMLINSGKMDDDMMAQFVNKETELMAKKNGLLSARDEAEKSNKNNNSSGSANDLKDAANELKDAAKQLKEFDVSDEEFNNALGEEKPKNKLMSRLEAAGNYLVSPQGLEDLNDLRDDFGGLRDTMYLEGEPGEYKKGAFGTEVAKKDIEGMKKGNVKAYVNNQNNIDYMKQEHGLNDKEAKARLEAGAPYINRGITDVATIDKLITAEQRTGKSPVRTMMSVAKVETVVNDQSRISAVSQIIARQTGERVESPKVQQAARETMQQARPYVESGKTNPEVLHRLVQLESNLKNHKIAAGSRTPQKVIAMDKIIDKAMKDGFKKIKLDVPQGSAGMKQIENAMNKELKDRIAINAPKK